MARTGQRHTARDLAARLGQGYAFAVEFLELGLGDQREQARHAGEDNLHGFHGSAILSPHVLGDPVLIRLERDSHWFSGERGGRGKRRIGGRIAQAATLAIAGWQCPTRSRSPRWTPRTPRFRIMMPWR